MIPCPYAYRFLGPVSGERRLVDAAVALAGYASCEPTAEVDREGYLSAFNFGEDFRALADSWGILDVRGFNGPCWSSWVWWDLDRPDNLDAALVDARRLAASILQPFPTLDDDDLLLFYSGSEGFHVGLPTAAWHPAPSAEFNRVARMFAERIAEQAGVTIDSGVYDKARVFRAPNSRHPKTGRHKRRLSFAELMGLSIGRILELAERPEPFDGPAPTGQSDQAAANWRDAEQWVREQAEGKAQRRVAGNGPMLNRLTLDFIRDGADHGDRHRRAFSAAANLGEFHCPPALAHALLTPAALDSGLSPGDVRRQIDCGLAHGSNGQSPPHSSTPPAVPDAAALLA